MKRDFMQLTGVGASDRVSSRLERVRKSTNVGDLEVLWELFERTGSVEIYLLFHEAKKNALLFERAKRDVEAMKKELESN